MIKASLNDHRQSPRKVRLVANLVKGKKVDQALSMLAYTVKGAATPVAKLIQSAVSNAQNNFGLDRANLYVKDIQVNPGATLKRMMPRARGSAYQILKRTCHIDVTLAEKQNTKK
jgi:large subunit ribosomal protein L22